MSPSQTAIVNVPIHSPPLQTAMVNVLIHSLPSQTAMVNVLIHSLPSQTTMVNVLIHSLPPQTAIVNVLMHSLPSQTVMVTVLMHFHTHAHTRARKIKPDGSLSVPFLPFLRGSEIRLWHLRLRSAEATTFWRLSATSSSSLFHLGRRIQKG